MRKIHSGHKLQLVKITQSLLSNQVLSTIKGGGITADCATNMCEKHLPTSPVICK
jgi:hypothetical protein